MTTKEPITLVLANSTELGSHLRYGTWPDPALKECLQTETESLPLMTAFHAVLQLHGPDNDAIDWNLHKQAVKKLGVLAPDEMYTLVPPLALGGSASIEHVPKDKVLPYLSLLAQHFKKSK